MTTSIIFTDIDGTLIDFNTYATDVTQPVVAELVAQGVPIILCSSKTRQEQEHYRQIYGLPDPFIVENGSAIYIPCGYFFPSMEPGVYETIVLGTPHHEIQKHLQQIRQDTGLKFSTYDDLSLPEICHITGLSSAQAESARSREYSATILTSLSTDDHARLSPALLKVGLQLLAGGRFHTVTGIGTDKGRAVSCLADLYKKKFGEITTIGLGDSANDLAMLRTVDQGYLVRKPDQTWDNIKVKNLVLVNQVGPMGWCSIAGQIVQGKVVH